MPTVEKPATLTFVEADVAAAWQGAAFWDHLLLAIPFDEGTGSPQAWVRGVGKIATTTTGGGSGPTWSDDANLGTVLTYVRDSLDRTSIANANLPANFPGKANTPFTVLFYGTIADVGVANNILTKQSNTDDPYLLSVTSAGKVSAGISTINYVGTTVLAANTPYLIGSVWDGANVHLLVDGTREGTTARTAALPTNTGDMRFATRQDLGNCWGGKAGILYVLDAAIAESVTLALRDDPYGPVTADAGGDATLAPTGLALAASVGTPVLDSSSATYHITGTVTLGGSPVQNATVRLYDQTADGYVSDVLTDVSGGYEFTSLDNTHQYHASVEYESGGTQYRAASQPFLTPDEV